MKYMGSKNRIAKDIVPIIQSCIDNNNVVNYLEPFVGGANVIDKIRCENRYGCDSHKELIAFLKGLSEGYIPPMNISEDEYKYIKEHRNEYNDCFLGYVGFQLSYGAKWFDTFRRDKVGKRKYDEEAFRNVMKQAPNLKGVKFYHRQFQTLKKDKIKGYVVYCDPPYHNTTKYATNDFPYDEFYQWCIDMSKNNIVLISEYNMPEQFECIWQKELKCTLDKNSRSNKVEKLWKVKEK
jgi:site-specific DNA-adenine methylase